MTIYKTLKLVILIWLVVVAFTFGLAFVIAQLAPPRPKCTPALSLIGRTDALMACIAQRRQA